MCGYFRDALFKFNLKKRVMILKKDYLTLYQWFHEFIRRLLARV